MKIRQTKKVAKNAKRKTVVEKGVRRKSGGGVKPKVKPAQSTSGDTSGDTKVVKAAGEPSRRKQLSEKKLEGIRRRRGLLPD